MDKLFKIKPSIFNWKAYFRRLLGFAIDVFVKKTHRKVSKRFEGAAGIKLKHKHDILVAMRCQRIYRLEHGELKLQ